MKTSSSPRLDPDIVLRAVAICMVVLNHASITSSRPLHLGGGLNILLLLSGCSFARFIFSGSDMAAIRKRIVRFAAGVWLPCLGIILLSFALKREWSWAEVFFVSNLYSDEHIALLYVWYPQVLLQLMVILYALTFLPGIAALLRRRPALIWLGLLGLSIVLVILLSASRGTKIVFDRTVQAIAWNFFLGGVVWHARGLAGQAGWSARGLVLALALVLSLLVFDVSADWLRAIALCTSVAVMLGVSRLSLPRRAARSLAILSQAAFTIYLWHVFFLRAFDGIGLRHAQVGFNLRDTVVASAFALAGSLAIWILTTSISRAWRHERRVSLEAKVASRPARMAENLIDLGAQLR